MLLHMILIFGLLALYLRYLLQRHQQQKLDEALAKEHGCQAPTRLQNQRPFGVDRLEQIFRADAESRLMELFLFHFRLWGNTLEQIFLGTKAFGTIEPANIEAILSTSFNDFGTGPRRVITIPMFGDGIFTQEGAAWKRSRDLIRPQFIHKHYEDLRIFRQAVDDLIDNVSSGGVIDLQPLFFRLTLDTTTSFVFGESVRSLKAPESAGEQTFAEAFNTAQQYVMKRFRLLDLYWLIGGRKFRQACDDVTRFADQIIERNLSREVEASQSKDDYDFLHSVAGSTQDRAAVRGQAINILVAGRDTTACLLSWIFFLLVRHPAVFEKLRKEVTANCTDHSKLTRTDLRNMNYLQNVIKETLRLYPSVPVNTRTSNKTTILPTGGGPDGKSPVLIPKGSAVAYSVYSMHRRPDLYGLDAELFRPERWDEDMPLKHDQSWSKWGYLPFNGGPRVCLGMNFALAEAAYTVVRLILRFPSIKLPLNEKVELMGVEKQTMTLVMSLTNGCNVDITP
ncbi:MAG: hypothetical protein M1820_008890 [Bogoriella megaspora]|nr:MAG: hypothetical protein M1820_008890 [Bogoriella megaspora]